MTNYPKVFLLETPFQYRGTEPSRVAAIKRDGWFEWLAPRMELHRQTGFGLWIRGITDSVVSPGSGEMTCGDWDTATRPITNLDPFDDFPVSMLGPTGAEQRAVVCHLRGPDDCVSYDRVFDRWCEPFVRQKVSTCWDTSAMLGPWNADQRLVYPWMTAQYTLHGGVWSICEANGIIADHVGNRKIGWTNTPWEVGGAAAIEDKWKRAYCPFPGRFDADAYTGPCFCLLVTPADWQNQTVGSVLAMVARVKALDPKLIPVMRRAALTNEQWAAVAEKVNRDE